MINLTEQYPPTHPIPHGPVLLSFAAWDELKGFIGHVEWRAGIDPDREIADRVHAAVRDHYTSRFYTHSEWFRRTKKHDIAMLAYGSAPEWHVLRQIATLCADGVAVISYSESETEGFSLSEDYFSRRIIEETYVDQRETFLRAPSGA